jgi:hypothetical protein
MDNWLMLCGLSLMRQGSATVEADVTVTEGQRVAEVGNSVSTAEPRISTFIPLIRKLKSECR